jgi:hypothetical protein
MIVDCNPKNVLTIVFCPIEKKKDKYKYPQSNSVATIPCKLGIAAKQLISCHRTP